MVKRDPRMADSCVPGMGDKQSRSEEIGSL